MKTSPERARKATIPGAKAPRGQIPLRLSNVRPILIPPSSLPKRPQRVTVKGSATHIHHGAISSQTRTPSTYRSILFPADEAFPDVKNKPIKANSVHRNKLVESIQAVWYCLVFYPLYPLVVNPDKARS